MFKGFNNYDVKLARVTVAVTFNLSNLNHLIEFLIIN